MNTFKLVISSIAWLLYGLLTSYLSAQPNSPSAVVGKVVEASTGEPMEFVDVVLFNNESEDFITGVITDEKGQFLFEDPALGKYHVQVSFVGYETKKSRAFSVTPGKRTDLGEIRIEINVLLLEEVEVVGQRSILNLGIDRKVYNVEEDILSQTNSVTEILQNLPSVTVDVNGQVNLRGTSNISFLINGRPSALLRSGGSAALQQIPASTIERVEVITNPSARYRPDGAGGIINIVLKDANREGINGTVQGNVGNLDRYTANLSLNYGLEDANFFVTYGIRDATTPQDIFDRRIERDGAGNTLNSFSSRSDVSFGELSHIVTAGSDFPLGENGVLEITGEYFYLNNDNNSLTEWSTEELEEDVPLSRNFTIDRNYNGFEQEYDIGVAYEHEFGNEDHALAIEANFGGYDEKEDNVYFERYLSPQTGQFQSRNLIKKGGPVTEFVVDYGRPIGEESELEIGYLAEFVRDDIDILGENLFSDWIADPGKTYRFKFDQNMHAGYIVFGHAIEAFSFSAGLRAEWTDIKSDLSSTTTNEIIKNPYNNFFPSLSLAYEFDDFEELQLSYSKRINRADPDEHNPFPEYDDPRTRDAGNPRLLPEQIHSVELAYRKQTSAFTFMPALYYRYKFDAFTELREIQQDSILHTTFINFSNETLAGLELVFRGNVSDNINLNFSSNFYYNELDGSNLGLAKHQSQISWDAKLGANLRLSKTTFAQLNAHYLSSRLTPQGKFRPLALLNLGLRQDIFNRNASLVFTVSDLFASLEFENIIDNPNLFWNTNYGRNNQIFYLGVSYHFGQSYVSKRKRKPEQLEFEDVIEVPNAPEEEEEEEEE